MYKKQNKIGKASLGGVINLSRCAKSTMPQADEMNKPQLEESTSKPVFDVIDILNSLPFYVLLVDSDHNIVQANKAVLTNLGLEPQNIIGGYCPKVVHGVDGNFHGCPLEEAIEKDAGVEREVYDANSKRWLRSAIYPTERFTPAGKRIYFHMVTDITERKQAEEQLKEAHESLRTLSTHLETVREEERRRIARDLHDETSQVVSSLSAYLEAALDVLPGEAVQSRALINKAQTLSIKILDELHDLIYELHSFSLDDLGLVPAIKSLIDTNLRPAGIEVSFRTMGKVRSLNHPVEMSLFRVIQEAIRNIINHSHAHNVKLILRFTKRSIALQITDNGVGFDVDRAIGTKGVARGLGLLGMKERVELAKGSLSIQSHPDGGGCELDIEIPT